MQARRRYIRPQWAAASEEFVLEQKDVVDPYQDYFGSGVFAFVVEGMRGISLLTPNPVKVEFDLNDLRRFDRPGRYRLYLKSHRLTHESEFAAVSNILEIEILADDAAWKAAKLPEIRAVLDRPEPERPASGPIKPLIDKIALAWRELRYLGTVDAVHWRRLRTPSAPDRNLRVTPRLHFLSLPALPDRERRAVCGAFCPVR